MAKSKYIVEILSHGIYTGWDGKSKLLPNIQTFTTDIPAAIDVEFGFTVNIKKGKGKILRYCIYHPDITTDTGDIMPPFDGEVHIRNNDWDFYLGDTIWAPIENKLGDWRMLMEIDGVTIAEKTFNLYAADQGNFWKRRGY